MVMDVRKRLTTIQLNFKTFWRRIRWPKLNPYCVVGCASLVIGLIMNGLSTMSGKDNDCVCTVQESQGNATPNEAFSYVVYGRNVDAGHLRHVYDMFAMFGYQRAQLETGATSATWDVMWAHDYPFQKLERIMKNLAPHQKVNHFPGCGVITNKMDLATSELKFVPKAFRLPESIDDLREYGLDNPLKKFVQKNNDHRGIKVASFERINKHDLYVDGAFVQEFIDNPLLVDGYKFDIGVYTIITSFDPLRVYMYNGDALFRYCPEKYYPFDADNVNKYVVGDDYLPTWDVPSLRMYYKNNGFSMKDSFNAYMFESGRDPTNIWLQIEEAIRLVCLSKEPKIMKYLNLYKSKRNFFEMMRFDFVVDDDLNVFIMEVNMSPNLSSAHFVENQLLYEQVLFNVFSLVGLGTGGYLKNERVMVSDKNLVVSPENCAKCTSCVAAECQLCIPCMTSKTVRILKDAYLEHMNRKDCKRIFPVPYVGQKAFPLDNLGPENIMLLEWFREKCERDISWC